ncbi:hypothetical protein LYNGBM3L_50860 [Moorena producens 3L]|uniref:Uncharacterized protein n=1 Tax=Moorena producens 3L TaxID=489825 RepID=F4XYK4_9CYAN|nr:hypothetical protein LYNGBM3L_50860 [Moorena producens 3L]OLT67579.1 hypothetical protein BI334_23385 [Moorena producens 3L]
MVSIKPVSTKLLRAIAKPDKFTSFEQERDSRKQHLVACRVGKNRRGILSIIAHKNLPTLL